MHQEARENGAQIIHFDVGQLRNFALYLQTNGKNSNPNKRRRQHASIIDIVRREAAEVKEDQISKSTDDRDEIYDKWIRLLDRELIVETKSPVDLKGALSNADGLDEVQPNVLEFRTNNIKLGFDSYEPLLEIRNKSLSNLSSRVLLTVNLLSGMDFKEIENLKSEILVLNLSPQKIDRDFIRIVTPNLSLSFDLNTNEIRMNISYFIDLKECIEQRFHVDYVNKVASLVAKAFYSSCPWGDREEKTSNIARPHDALSPQLFYNTITNHAENIRNFDRELEIPELNTNLLPFQKKTVGWLLEKEGMQYNFTANGCVKKDFLGEDVKEMISDYFNNKLNHLDYLDYKIYLFLNTLCYGWRRIEKAKRYYWFNKYTCNLASSQTIYKFALNCQKEMENGYFSSTACQGLLAEEMGLGKTVEVTSLILLNQRPLKEVNDSIEVQLQPFGHAKKIVTSKSTLIIAPDSIIRQWTDEIRMHSPSLAITVYGGMNNYPKLENNPSLIAEFLRKFDIVLTTYSIISKELDYALYSSRNKPTRSTNKRNLYYSEANDEAIPSDESTTNNDVAKEEDKNDIENLVSSYQANFQLSLQTKRPSIANKKTKENQKESDYEKELQDEIYLAIKSRKIPDIYRKNDYESPLMLSQFWRVVVDEIQMVSSKMSRAFQTATLIPRFHAWGVSGTPIKKDVNDLFSVLRYLKCQPFVGYLAKNSWSILTNFTHSNNNEDFIRLWRQLGLRHTKAMVHDDIQLPPQSRILMTTPFTPVEQENYNQVLEDCLASICLDVNGNPILSDWEPTSTILTYMRNWLVRLRQICSNPQIGKLNLSSRKSKNLSANRKVLSTAQQLKTLDKVLEDMLVKVSDQITSTETSLVQLLLEVSQFFEYIYLPEYALEFLKVGSREAFKICHRVRKQLDNTLDSYKEHRSRLNLRQVDDEVEDNEDDFNSLTNNSSLESEKEGLVSLQEKLRSLRMRLRNWYIIIHKFCFLMASGHFQCYDQEYKSKVDNFRLQGSYLNENLDLLKDRKDTDEISSLVCEIPVQEFQDFDYHDIFVKYPDITSETKEENKHRLLELHYYDKAEVCRRDILKSSIDNVSRSVNSKIISRTWYCKADEHPVDDGTMLIPRTSKKFFNALPLIKIDYLKDWVTGMKPKFYVEKFEKLVYQLNREAELSNQWVGALVAILCKPLISHDQNPDGEEYEESILDQDKAACYLQATLQLLSEREITIQGAEKQGPEKATKFASSKVGSDSVHDELLSIQDSEFFKQLQEKRKEVRPLDKVSFQDIVLDAKNIEAELQEQELLDPNGNLELELFNKMAEKVRTYFNNQKLALTLLQKEINSSCNSVFNARIEYYKHLQQISDTVKLKDFNFSRENISKSAVEDEQSLLLHRYATVKSSLGKVIARYRYLKTLTRYSKNSSGGSDDEELQCVICRTTITIGALTQCGHKYCKECLELWLRSHRTCPMCKMHINPSTIYHFTHHRPNLNANNVANGIPHKSADNLHSIYKPIDKSVIDEIQRFQLKNSYSSKVDLIVKQVLYLKSKDPNVQIVIFSQWQDLLYIIGTAFLSANISFLGSHGTLTPDVGAGRYRAKYDSVEEFKKSPNITCFLLNARAQASGLTLVNATHIFLCEPLVNTSLELQAISRIHRIGQTRHTTVWVFAIENTVEESILLMSTNKRLQYLAERDENKPAISEKISKSEEKDLSQAESMTLMRSGGNDTLINKGNGEGESVTNEDLWNAFFCARSESQSFNSKPDNSK